MVGTELLLTLKACVQECAQLSIYSNETGTPYGRLQHGLIKDVKFGGSMHMRQTLIPSLVGFENYDHFEQLMIDT